MKQIISTPEAPRAIGTYSQAIKVGNTVYMSGQIPLDPATMELVSADMTSQVRQIFTNLQAVAVAAGGSLAHIVKLTVYLINMGDFAVVNQVMPEFFAQPYPARAVVGVAALPKWAQVEVEAIMVLAD